MKRYTSAPALIRSPRALALMARGAERVSAPLALTLGPTRSRVLGTLGRDTPEFLDDSGVIAERLIACGARGEHVGGMLLRNLAMTMRERFGDGAATACVLARAMIREGVRLIAAGMHPAAVSRGLRRGSEVAVEALAAQAMPVEGLDALIRLATSACGDAELGAILGELFDTLGHDAGVIVEEYPATRLDREYVEGGQWLARPGSWSLFPDGQNELTLRDALVFALDEPLERVEQALTALELAVATPGRPPLLIVAQEFSGKALNLLMANHLRGTLSLALAVPASSSAQVSEDIRDLALLTGAETIGEQFGRSAERLERGSFGRARRARLTRDALTVIGGAGERAALQRRLAEVRAQVARLSRADDEWRRLRLRQARLAGGVGILKIGAASEHERTLKREAAYKAQRTLDATLEAGVVPGGGVAYLGCIPRVEAERARCADIVEGAGVELVAQALTAPFRQIVRNHGALHPPVALAEAQRRGAGYGFDAESGDFAHMARLGVLDSLPVTQGALAAAASAAAMALATEALVFTNDEGGL